ncbi:MAG: 50S ribosomal protein L23 [Chloroflexi bacterium 13_1_40CM_4_68_4]|nr:MAG: 50S ribosomal protein L23 [Chloroflexi bacterium 13_1_40CM_4_68_4]
MNEVLVRPVITEKSMVQANEGQYTFEVAPGANKHQVKDAVEIAFKVNVLQVRVMKVPGKMRRVGRKIGKRPDRRKAIVRLAEGQKIERFFVEGV